MFYYADTSIYFFVPKELGNTISSLFGGGSQEPTANVTEPVQVQFNIRKCMHLTSLDPIQGKNKERNYLVAHWASKSSSVLFLVLVAGNLTDY